MRTTSSASGSPRADIYQRITDRILADLEQGVRPWFRPWSVDHAVGRITRPRRHNGVPYQGINVVMLWSEAVAQGYVSPFWLTFRQALAVGGHVKKGETGELVVYADRLIRTATNAEGVNQRRIGTHFQRAIGTHTAGCSLARWSGSSR